VFLFRAKPFTNDFIFSFNAAFVTESRNLKEKAQWALKHCGKKTFRVRFAAEELDL